MYLHDCVHMCSSLRSGNTFQSWLAGQSPALSLFISVGHGVATVLYRFLWPVSMKMPIECTHTHIVHLQVHPHTHTHIHSHTHTLTLPAAEQQIHTYMCSCPICSLQPAAATDTALPLCCRRLSQCVCECVSVCLRVFD